MALNRLKKLSRHKECSTEGLEISSEEELLEQRCLKNERNACLYRAMAQLKPEYREVLHLLFFEGMKNAEAAKVMKKNTRQIENLAYRAKRSLRSRLEKEDFDVEGL